MDADGWDRSDDPRALVAAAGGRVSARKWRLALTAVVRDRRSSQDVPSLTSAYHLAERQADGLIEPRLLAAGYDAARVGWADTEVPLLLVPDRRLAEAVLVALPVVLRQLDPERVCRHVREVVGNPFRWVRWDDGWATRTAHTLAADGYARGRFDTLPVLADALEDAGCDNAELLAHLRGPGPHVRGCWALDVVLGKV